MSFTYNTDIPKNTMTNYAEAFPGSVICPSNTNVAEKLAMQGDQIVMDNNIKSFILERGYPVLYYPYLFEVDKAEHLFGEHSGAGYGVPFKTYAYMTIEDQPSWFAAQGIDTDETATIWIHIKLWKDTVIEYLQDPECPQYHDYHKIYNLNYIAENDIIKAIEISYKLSAFPCELLITYRQRIAYGIISYTFAIIGSQQIFPRAIVVSIAVRLLNTSESSRCEGVTLFRGYISCVIVGINVGITLITVIFTDELTQCVVSVLILYNSRAIGYKGNIAVGIGIAVVQLFRILKYSLALISC